MIRVFLIDDDFSALSALQKILNLSPEITVVGTAQNVQQALELIPQLSPDVLCSEAYLPGLEAVALVRQLMDACPLPILIISTAVSENPMLITELMAAGVLDRLAKPAHYVGFEESSFSKELTRKIKVLSGVMVFRRKPTPLAAPVPPMVFSGPSKQIVVIGASTGGPQAFEAVLSKLPANYPFPVVCIQHISKGFLDPFMLWLNGKVKLPVMVAKSGEKPEGGRIYFAPDDANLKLDAQGCFTYSHAPEFLHYPSIDVTFHAIAEYYASETIAVLMTGMGDDGVGGLKAIAHAGGVTIAQDEASCVVFGMPKVAIESGAAQKVLNLVQIAEVLLAGAQVS